jgi:sugar/nucleoside kinase (ribokinase family)
MDKVTVIGDVNVDLLLSPIENYPRKDLQERISWLKVEVGGGAAHVALALSKLGVKTKLIGLIGNDLFGKFILEKMKKFGVESMLKTVEKETGISIGINFEDGSRSLLTYRGTNSLFSLKDFNLSEVEGNVLFLSGYGLLEKLMKDAEKVLSFAKKKGMITCLDPDIKSYRSFDINKIKKALKFVDFFFPDMEEGKLITREKDNAKIIEKLLRIGCKTVALKLGGEGCIVADENNFIEVEAIETKAINSTGAGDFFNAGFVFGYLKHKDLEKAGDFGNATAAFAISRFGDERYPSKADVEKLVKGYEWKER